MGIQGLLNFLKESSVNCNVKEFKGKTAAIDGYCWLHKGAFSCADKLVKGEKTDAYVTYCMKYVNMLISNGVQPVMVFDGQPLPSKLGTEIGRRENRERYKMQAREFLRQGKTGDARKCFQKCVDISSEMALELMKACRAKNVDCIVAPYEADAQLAYLSLQGMVDLVITEDSDLLAFGCARVLFKMDLNGNGVLIEREKLCLSLGNRADFFNFEKFRRMCILSGCDYLPSLPGIGLGKAFKFFSRSTDVDINAALCRLPGCLNMPQLDVSLEYREAFIKAEQTFLYQLVYDPVIRKLVPLTPYPEGADHSAFPFAGGYLEDETAFQLAVGNLNVDTLAKLCDFHPDRVVLLKTTGSLWSNTKRPVVTPTKTPVDALSPSIGGPSPLCKKIRAKVEFSLPVVISDDDLTIQYSTAATVVGKAQLNSPPGSPILGHRKRKRSDENDPNARSPSGAPKGYNPFAKLKQNTPSPEKGRTLRASLSQCIQKDSSGQEIITSSYFSTNCEINVKDRLIKSVGERQGHLILPVKSSKAVQSAFKPVLTSTTSTMEINSNKAITPISDSNVPTFPTTSVKESIGSRPIVKNGCRVAGLSRTAMQPSKVGGGMRQLSLRDMFKQ